MDTKVKQSMTLFAQVIRGEESKAQGLEDENLGPVAYWNEDPIEEERFKREHGINGTITTATENDMRVAVYPPDSETPFAYRVGRITDHTDILTGETTPAHEVAEKLTESAKREYPDHSVYLECFEDNGDGTGSWTRKSGQDPEPVITHTMTEEV